MKVLCLAVVCLFAATLSAEEWKRDFTVGPHPSLRVQTNDARIEVHGRPGNTVSAHVVAEGYHIGPGEVSVTAQQNGNSVFVQVKVPDRHIHFNLGNRSLRIEIEVPQEIALDLSSSDGSIHISSVKGDARLATSDGSVRVENFEGSLHGHTSDGSIEIGGRFEQLDLSTSDGHIRADIWKGSHMTGEWNLRSSDGSINVGVPDDLGAYIDASTGDGHLDLQLPIEVSGRLDRHMVHGKLHGGGPVFRVHTSDGSITFRPI
jgi:DUF4097 and DUF4098 domain-containing protein YvlB